MQKINLIGPLKLNFHQINFQNLTYFVDGGLQYKSLFPHSSHSFGDGDSTNTKLDISFAIEKDFSDSYGALKYLLKAHNNIAMHGFYGARNDHLIALIGDILGLLEEFPNKRIEFNTNTHEAWVFSSHQQSTFQHKGEFSLFSLREQLIKYQNTDYPKDKMPVKVRPLSSIGLSNKSEGLFEISNTYPILMIFNR